MGLVCNLFVHRSKWLHGRYKRSLADVKRAQQEAKKRLRAYKKELERLRKCKSMFEGKK